MTTPFMHGKSSYVELQSRSCPSTPDPSTELQPHFEVPQGRPWKNGLRRLPVLGLLALLGTALCSGASVYILMRSNGQPVDTWRPLQPTVYLAIFSSVANIVHSFALGEGLVNAWWSKALKSTTLHNLHYTWHSGTSVKGALVNLLLGREVLMAVACLLTTLSIARGPLFQRASSVQQATVPSNGTVELHVAQVLQSGYAGQISGRTTSPSFMTPAFTRVIQAYNNRDPMTAIDSGCPSNTTCVANVRGFGFGVQCNNTRLPYSMENKDKDGGVSFPSVDVFVTSPGYREIYGFGGAEELDENFKPLQSPTGNNALVFNNTYLDEDVSLDSIGHLKNRMCSLRAGIVSYPITISNGTSLTFRSSSWKDDTFLEDRGFFGIEGTTESNLAGFYLAASYLFSGTASLSFGGGVGYILNIEGLTAAQYVNTNGTSSGGSFGTTWLDPTDDILNAMREIAFRAALQVGQNASYPNSTQQLPYSGEHQQTIYRSDHRFTVAATAVSLLGVFAILPTFFGFTRLGRAVTLSPIEVAKAFDAPVLHDVAGNVSVDEMLGKADKTKVRYGELISEFHQEGSSVVHRLAVGPVRAGNEARRGVLYI